MLHSDFGNALVSGAQKSGALELVDHNPYHHHNHHNNNHDHNYNYNNNNHNNHRLT